MQEEELPEVPVVASLKKLEQRYPELANLLDLRPSNSQPRIRRPVLREAEQNDQGTESLSDEEKQVMGKWLQSHYDRLAQKLKRIDPNFPV
jgi:hypothetical protein